MKKLIIPAKDVKGFNYHPSYSTGSLEDWLLFDKEVWEKELTIGKKHFPKFNTLRIWLSWNAYCRMGDDFIKALKDVFDICKKLNLYVIPCLFNRWHDPVIDCDGIYIDHFLKDSSWLQKFGSPFTKYIDDIAENFKDEEQVLVWDVCNEPLAYNNNEFPAMDIIKEYELRWLHEMADRLRMHGVSQPLGIGSTGDEAMETFGDICDVYLTHFYYTGNLEKFDAKVKRFCDEAIKNGKEIISSECCWGSLDDQKRGEFINGTLSTLKKYNVGFVAHALWTCGCTDLHDITEGAITQNIGNLAFIKKDGTIRPYHEAYNDY